MWEEEKTMIAALIFIIIAIADVKQAWASLSSFDLHQMTHLRVWGCIHSVKGGGDDDECYSA